MIRYLQGKCLRLESWRKALVWQKRYLQRVIAGFQEIEMKLMPATNNTTQLRGRRRFRCIVNVVVTVIRMGYLVRRRQHVRSVAAACLLRDTHTPVFNTPLSKPHLQVHTPTQIHLFSTPSKTHTLNMNTPTRPNALASRLLKHDLGFDLPHEHGEDLNRRSPYTNTPQGRQFISSYSRSEAASTLVNKLETASRCLGRNLDDKNAP
ncbi:unnamed protein product [Leptosia nina]|uniref:Pericentrin/AKAP-450 centrosomal targeting domain-containing protein n=1 Tax=Leptosia nina TaxID=320188 RepID=A0AAV1K4E8_9NEOP